MSYRCDKCNEVHYGPSLKYVDKIRPMQYEHCIMKQSFDENRNKVMVVTPVKESTGTEIASELYLCDKCFNNCSDVEPKMVEPRSTRNMLPKRISQDRNKVAGSSEDGNFKSFNDAFSSRKGKYADKRYEKEDYNEKEAYD